MAGIEGASHLLDRAVGWLCALFFGAMTVIVLLGVLFRYVLNAPLSWVEESSRYLMIWGASSAISLGIASNEHVGLTILLDGLKARLPRVLLLGVITLLQLVFFAVLFYYALRMTADARYMQTQALGFPMAVAYLAIPVSMVFALVQSVLTFVLRVSRDEPSSGEAHIIDI